MIKKLLPILTDIIRNRYELNNFYKKLDLFDYYDKVTDDFMRDEMIVKYLDSLITLEDLDQIFKTLQDMKKYIEDSYDDNNKKSYFFFFKSIHEIIY